MPFKSREAQQVYWRKWRNENRPKVRGYERKRHLKERYGISPDEWDRMFASQEGKCAICGTNSCITGRRFSVDHDHQTGDVRGLLCYRCNSFIGAFERKSGWDGWTIGQRITAYLKRSD